MEWNVVKKGNWPYDDIKGEEDILVWDADKGRPVFCQISDNGSEAIDKVTKGKVKNGTHYMFIDTPP